MKEDKQQSEHKQPEYDKQQKEDKDLREYEDARRRIRENLFGDLSVLNSSSF